MGSIIYKGNEQGEQSNEMSHWNIENTYIQPIMLSTAIADVQRSADEIILYVHN